MKKLLLLISILLLSCKKETAVTETLEKNDSLETVSQPVPEVAKNTAAERDSIINNAPATKEVLREGVMRDVEGNRIIRFADAEALPFRLGEVFTDDNQELVLKIQNFAKEKITVLVKPQTEQQNIRINQIKLPNGTMDGPFGRELYNYEVPEKGEVWLFVGKSNMASGDSKGSFSVSVE